MNILLWMAGKQTNEGKKMKKRMNKVLYKLANEWKITLNGNERKKEWKNERIKNWNAMIE